jgi:hypothetical protein
MKAASRRRLARAALAGALVAAVTGCALPVAGPLVIEKPESSALAPGVSVQAARDAVVVGQSTRAQVAAALGPATIVRFDSGYEVWVYRTGATAGGADSPSEFVILFAPDGIAKKTRIAPLQRH